VPLRRLVIFERGGDSSLRGMTPREKDGFKKSE
jgi:hypothetical protein